MEDKIIKVARAGHISKGVIYAITGFLAFSAAFGLGSSNGSEGKLGVLKFLQDQSFGNIILGILGLGLLCYSFWRLYQSTVDPENIGDDEKGTAKRVGFFLSGLVYLGLAIYSFYLIFSAGSGGSGGGSEKGLIPTEYLPYVFYTVAAGLAIKAIFQFVKAYKGDFLKKFKISEISDQKKVKTIKWFGYAGLISRGIVVGIVSYFIYRAADTASTQNIKGTSEAFQFLRESSGPWLMGLVALGLICYGAYMFAMAKYRRFD